MTDLYRSKHGPTAYRRTNSSPTHGGRPWTSVVATSQGLGVARNVYLIHLSKWLGDAWGCLGYKTSPVHLQLRDDKQFPTVFVGNLIRPNQRPEPLAQTTCVLGDPTVPAFHAGPCPTTSAVHGGYTKTAQS